MENLSNTILWVPGSNDSDVEAEPAPLGTIFHPDFGDIRIPHLSLSKSQGENARIRNFLSQEDTVWHYYNEFIEFSPDGFYTNSTNIRTSEADKESDVTVFQTNKQLRIRRTQSVPTLVNKDCNWERLVGEAITLLERKSLGTIQTGDDDVDTCVFQNKNLTICLIRPKQTGMVFQVCLLYGHRRWRRRGSIHASLLRITFGQTDTSESAAVNMIDTSCSCITYLRKSNCEHRNSVLSNVSNYMRLYSFRSRGVLAKEQMAPVSNWEIIEIPNKPNDNVRTFHVFKRAELSSIFPTSSTVILDTRASKSRKPISQRLFCVLCPGKASRRMLCVHESQAEKSISDNGIRHTSSVSDGEKEVEPYWDAVLNDSETDIGDAAVALVVSSENDGNASKHFYESRKSRNVFACPSEDASLLRILRESLENKGQEGDRETGCFVGIDDIVDCPECKYDARGSTSTTESQRKVWLHTLHHGEIEIVVTDLTCGICGACIPYDGLSDAIFCVTKKHTFSRELLDMWLWDICGTGGTFRDAYSSWASKSYATSASFHRIGKLSNVTRQLSNDAFTLFLKALKFPRDEDLAQLFSCSVCETNDVSGEKYLGGIVMDGTALGILGALPNFSRHEKRVCPVPKIADRQYLMRSPKLRAFVEAVLKSAKSAGNTTVFYVKMKDSLLRKKDELISRLFSSSGGENDEAYLPSLLLIACYRIQSGRFDHESDDDNSDEDTADPSNELCLEHRIMDVDIRRTLIEFGRCFCSGSIAGGSLRGSCSVTSAERLSQRLRQYSLCNHGGSVVCVECRKELLSEGKASEENNSAAGRVAQAIASASAVVSTDGALRNIASIVSRIIILGIKVKQEYLYHFEQLKTEDVRMYNVNHRHGNGLSDNADRNWLSEAQRTGEFFPGRPQVRPLMNFGDSSRKENARSCRKNYVKSDTHSPGIFTVHCVCRNPKLIGISVMRECEGVSTALSVLLSRFRKLPQVCYYDNACNMNRSITLRCPWVYDDCIIVCDRFHYYGHTCNSVCDPGSYLACDDHATSGAESMNHLWNFSKSHLRFLRSDNLMPFLAVRAIFLNVRASIRQQNRKQDISAKDFRFFVQGKWQCLCSRCNPTNNE